MYSKQTVTSTVDYSNGLLEYLWYLDVITDDKGVKCHEIDFL